MRFYPEYDDERRSDEEAMTKEYDHWLAELAQHEEWLEGLREDGFEDCSFDPDDK